MRYTYYGYYYNFNYIITALLFITTVVVTVVTIIVMIYIYIYIDMCLHICVYMYTYMCIYVRNIERCLESPGGPMGSDKAQKFWVGLFTFASTRSVIKQAVENRLDFKG